MKLSWSLVLMMLSMTAAAESAKIASKDGVFLDQQRDREVPYRIYHPDPLQGRYPIVLISHGLGDSREGNFAFGTTLAARGYICVHLQHAGSDRDVFKGAKDRREVQRALQASLVVPANSVNRFEDVPFVVTQLARLDQEESELKDHLDLEAIGMAGHSYGAISTLVAAGQGVGRRSTSYKVRQLRAAVVLSPSPAAVTLAYENISIPLFHMTGTEDVSPPVVPGRDITPADRRKPFDALQIKDQYLLVLKDADHLTFAGTRIGTSEQKSKDRAHMAAVMNGAVNFFDAYLKRQDSRKAWLRDDYRKTLSEGDTFELK